MPLSLVALRAGMAPARCLTLSLTSGGASVVSPGSVDAPARSVDEFKVDGPGFAVPQEGNVGTR